MRTHVSILALLAASIAFAEEPVELGTITRSANLDETEVDSTGATVEVIDDEDIADASTTTLASALGNIAGVSTSSTGPVGSQTSVVIRGARTYETKTLINGVDVSDPSGTQNYFDFQNMISAGVRNVEVVKGSQSAIHGSSAVGGVISISTVPERKEGFQFQGGVEYGSYDTMVLDSVISYGTEKAFLSYSTSRIETEGFSAAEENDGNTEADAYKGQNHTLHGEYDVTNALSLGFDLLLLQSEAEIDNGFVTPVADSDDHNEYDQTVGRAFARYDGAMGQLEVSYSAMDYKRDYYTVFGLGGYEAGRDQFSAQGSFEASDRLHLSFLADQTSEFMQETGGFGSGRFERDMSAIAAGADYAVSDQLDIGANLRYDNVEGFDPILSYRLAGVYRASDRLTYKASASTGFRAPSMYEQFSQPLTADLQPENSVSFDLGAYYQSETTRFGVALFQNATDNQIFYDAGEDAVYDFTTWECLSGCDDEAYVNISGETLRRGLELSGDIDVTDGTKLFANYTYIKTETPDGDRLAKIPAHEVNLGFDAQVTERFSLGTSVKVVADVLDEKLNALDDYTLVNARMAYEIGNGELYLRVENLFDAQYQTTAGYGTSDRAFYVGYRVDF